MVENMKKILIFSHAMELGGAERALLGLLEGLQGRDCTVDLFLMRHSGELMRFIPESVNLLPERPQYASLAVPIGHILRKGQLGVAIGRMVGKLLAWHTVHQLGLPDDNGVELEYSHKYTRFAMPMIAEDEYDLAVSFLTPHYFAAEKVKARRKAAWIHTDYTRVAVDTESEASMWDAYDDIISISPAVTEGFVKTFPSLESKVKVIGNIMAVGSILTQSREFDPTDEMPDDGSLRLLSVGRFCHAKNFDNVPSICASLRRKGLSIKWYIIGYGGDEDQIRQAIQANEMSDYVRILGKKENPYPYIRRCHVYVQPSRYEGNCVTVHEAQLLGKPVIITRYPTACSQLRDGVDGIIVPLEHDACAEAMANALLDDALLARIASKCAGMDHTNMTEADKLLALAEEGKHL